MNLRLRPVSFLLTLFLFSFNASAVDPVTLGIALNQMENSANRVLDRGEYTLNSANHNAAASVLHIIGDIRQKYQEMLNVSVDALDGRLKVLFDGLSSQSERIFSDIEKANDSLDESVNSLAIHVGHTWLGDKIPRVTKTGIPLVVEGKKKSYIVSFSGVFLDHSDNRLIVNGAEYPPVENQIKSLKYSIPSSAFESVAGDSLISISLLLHKSKYYFFSDVFENKFAVRRVPSQVGRLRISYNVENPVVDRSSRSEVKECQTRGRATKRNHCGVSELYKPLSGFKIDPGTISISHRTSAGECHSCSASKDNVSEHAFTLKIGAGARRKKGKLCVCQAIVSWTDYRERVEVEPHQTEEIALVVDEDAGIQLPDGTKNLVSAELLLFNGKKIIFTKSGVSSGVSLDFDHITKFVRVRTAL